MIAMSKPTSNGYHIYHKQRLMRRGRVVCSNPTSYANISRSSQHSQQCYINSCHCCNVLSQHEARVYDREEEWSTTQQSSIVVVVPTLVDSWLQLSDGVVAVSSVVIVGSKLISMNYNLCYQCLSIVFDFKRRLFWQPVGYQLATSWLPLGDWQPLFGNQQPTSRQMPILIWRLISFANPGSCCINQDLSSMKHLL